MIAKNRVSISIADSDIYFRTIIENRIESNPFYNLICKCSNGRELLNQLYRRQEDVFLIDLFMPILTGFEAIKLIRVKDRSTPILTYSNTFQEDIAELLKSYPNLYYCQKNSNVILDVLKNCILTKNKSFDEYFSIWKKNPQEVEEYFQRQKKNTYAPNLNEIQIMRLSFEGLNNKEIGVHLNLSSRTIDTYIKRLTEKLGIKNKIELIKFAVENGYHNFSI